jgi:integrase
VRRYLSSLVGSHKSSSIGRKLSAVAAVHRRRGMVSPGEDPSVRAVWRGIKRQLGVAQEARKPTLTQDLRAMLDHLPEGLVGVRDRAILLLGFAGALRRSEIVALTASSVALVEEGLVITIASGQTDQERRGRQVGVPYGDHQETCPVHGLLGWVEAAGITSGPLFRAVSRGGVVAPEPLSDRTVARIVQRALRRTGIDPKGFAAHSLRAGCAIQASMGGASEFSIHEQTGIRSTKVVRQYAASGVLFRDNAAKLLGL